jgi:hypothetical protein
MGPSGDSGCHRKILLKVEVFFGGPAWLPW